jgi:hypothetical protein
VALHAEVKVTAARTAKWCKRIFYSLMGCYLMVKLTPKERLLAGV